MEAPLPTNSTKAKSKREVRDDTAKSTPKPPTKTPTQPAKKSPRLHACNKTSFSKAFQSKKTLSSVYLKRLLNYIKTVHYIAKHTTKFLKYYILRGGRIALTKEHMYGIFHLINKADDWKPLDTSIKAEFLPHIRSYCKLIKLRHPRVKHDQQSAHYLGDSIMTNLEVNVKCHFMKMLLRYINLRIGRVSFEIIVWAVTIVIDPTLFCKQTSREARRG